MKVLAYLIVTTIGALAYDVAAATPPAWEPDHACCALRVESTVCDPKAPLFKFRYLTEQLSPPPRLGEKPRKICVVPNTVVPFGKGVLLGMDAGEFGGQLAYRDPKGNTLVLLRKNVKAIATVGSTYVLTGLSHLSGNEGAIYRIDKPSAALVTNLDGSPRHILALSNGISFQTVTFVRRADYGRPVFATRCYFFTPPSTVKAVTCDSPAA